MEENVPVGNAEGPQPSVNASYHLIFLHGNYNLTHYIFYFIDCISVQVQLFKTGTVSHCYQECEGLETFMGKF